MATEQKYESLETSESNFARVKSGISAVWNTQKGKLSLIMLFLIIFSSVLAPYIAPYQPTDTHSSDQFEAPSTQYILGTDNFGRDIFSRVLYGGRTSIILGIASTLLGLLFGVPLGILAGYLGGWVDEVIMRSMDVLLSIPSLLVALIVVMSLGSGVTNTIIAIGIVFIPRLARIARSGTLSIKNEEYVTAAKTRGESLRYICFKEILPNVSSAIIVEASIRIGFGILLATSLSFLGLGTQPPNADWGYMVAQSRDTLRSSIWFMLWPSLALGTTILSFNLLGDSLRDVLDPESTSEEL